MLPFGRHVEELYRLALMTRGGILHCSDEKIDLIPSFAWKLDALRPKQKESPITLAVGKDVDTLRLFENIEKYTASGGSKDQRSLQYLNDAIGDLKIYIANMKDLYQKKMGAMESLNRIAGKGMDEHEVETAPSVLRGVTALIRRPSSTRRPYHLFYMDSAAGGGDWLSIRNRMDHLLGYWFHTPLPAWRIDAPTANHEGCGCCNKNFEKIEYDWMEGNFEESEASMHRLLGDTAFGIHAMESLIEESSEILDEMTAWRALPCCMALHSRLGLQSPMRVLGADVMKMIMNF